MKKPKKIAFSHILNVLIISLIVESFLCTIWAVRLYAKDDCLARIEETATQASDMFVHTMEQNYEQLTLFADILGTNSSNPEPILLAYMENFCKTQSFSAVCLERTDGTHVTYGAHPHDQVSGSNRTDEIMGISDVLSMGESKSEKFIYQSVPIYRNSELVGILYGFIPLEAFSSFISCTMYGGNCEMFIVDGTSGNVLMNEYDSHIDNSASIEEFHDVNNIFDESTYEVETRSGYSVVEMRSNIRKGESGYYVFKMSNSRQWYYTYYMPITMLDAQGKTVPINNWSLMLTIDGNTAFATYNDVSIVVAILMVIVVALMLIHVLVLMFQNARSNKKDKDNLRKSAYINSVQRTLINAHTDPDFVDQSLQIIADEMKSETVILLIFEERKVVDVHYWPSKDRKMAIDLVGRNIREEFPLFFDALVGGNSISYSENDTDIDITSMTKEIFKYLEVSNLILVPIMDNFGRLKGALAAANVEDIQIGADMLECVTYDFFMAITNLENHRIIKNMGAMDYLTETKNRNSYEAELGDYASVEADTLWCVFVDVNGLHDVNNRHGHKAGDNMLCAVAAATKRAFGEKNTYRLGGDEFVSFMINSTHEEFMGRKYRMTEELAAQGYYVSIGFEGGKKGENGRFDVEKIVAGAEAIMYQDKWEFYQKNHIPSERGHFPSVMEKE